MIRSVFVCSIWLACSLDAQPPSRSCCMGQMNNPNEAAPIAGYPVVEFTGTVSEVHIGVGQGMPYVDVKQDQDKGTIRVFLGAMHYLISQDFNPKAGQAVSVKGYKVPDGVIGISVSLPAEKKTIRLRDEKGWPLWRGGPRRSAPQRSETQDTAKP